MLREKIALGLRYCRIESIARRSLNMKTYFPAIFITILLISASTVTMAQSSVTGAISGTVTDPNKAVVLGAAVAVRNIENNKESTATTDGEGRFRIVELQPGTYSVRVTMQNFRPFLVENILVEVGRVTTIDVPLTVGMAEPGIVTISTTPIINTMQQDFSANINQTALNELPINGRRWSNFALGTPAAAPDGGFGLVSFRGISGLLNNNTIDGGDNNQAFFSEERGRTRISYVIGLDSIREFQVNASNYSAEYGRAAGGVVNAITKSGTNEFHGSVFYYDRDSKLGARNPLSFQTFLINGVLTPFAIKPIDKREQFGGTVGGPILKNRVFFFFSYDQQKRNFPGVATTGNPAFFTTVNRGDTGAGLKAPNRLLTDAQIDSTIAFLTGLLGEVPRRGDQKIILPKVEALDWTDKSNSHCHRNSKRANNFERAVSPE
jgi:hypothetical protein